MKPGTRFWIGLAWIGCAILGQAQPDDELIVNGRALTPAESRVVHRLAQQYHWNALSGRYWYDSRSGLYGYAGQPPLGVIQAGLHIGGRLSARASNGTSGVYVNGRELTLVEVQRVSRCTVVRPGSYWVNADGTGGIVGQPASFNLVTLCRRGGVGTPGNRGWYGHVSGGGGTVGAIFSDGTGVTCGPDGGCIYSK